MQTSADLVVVGAGPAGSAAAAWAARSGREVVLVDSAVFPRDKTCGDGLTPRAVEQLELLGLGPWLDEHIRYQGLRLHGFGGNLEVPWPGPSFGGTGSAVRRTELDDKIRQVAVESGAKMAESTKAVDVERDSAGRVTSIRVLDNSGPGEITCKAVIVADGVRSTLGKVLGREWHKDTVYAVAGRAYIDSDRGDEEWMTSHLELRSPEGAVLPGYGWIFPLGGGQINIGVGALATSKRPADAALRPLIDYYTELRREDFGLSGRLQSISSALLPMGGAVSGVAGPNWMLIGDAAACVNPLNGEGIDYGLETGHLAAEVLDADDYSLLWPELLRERYGRSFSIARRLGALLTLPRFLPTMGPVGMRSQVMMRIAVRLMGNLVTDEDHDVIARAWRVAGGGSRRLDARPPFS
ncbi:menaquinone reductase [Mycobacterium sp. NPDC050853]|uniref:menaquinone reductase n=1 Tax=Mycobacterium sp. NPDC050853 TaxID=3155160 RepID=UPI0034086142